MRELRYKRANEVGFHFYEVQEQPKLIYGDRSQNNGYLGGGGGSGSQEPSGKWKISWTLIWVVATQVHTHGQVHRAVYLRGRSFTAFTPYLKTCSEVYFQNIYLTSSFSVFLQSFSRLHENISRMICTPLIILNRSYAEHLLGETRLSLETPTAKFSSHCFHTGRQ